MLLHHYHFVEREALYDAVTFDGELATTKTPIPLFKRALAQVQERL